MSMSQLLAMSCLAHLSKTLSQQLLVLMHRLRLVMFRPIQALRENHSTITLEQLPIGESSQ